jgi:hypothetical protein
MPPPKDPIKYEEWRQKNVERNTGKNNPNYGKHRSEETCKKISAANKGQIPWCKGKHLSEETKQKIRNTQIGRKASEETKRKIGLASKGKIVSEETKKKMSLKLSGEKNPNYNGKTITDEWRRKQYLAHKGKKHTETHKKNISLGGKGKKRSEETCNRISQAKRGANSYTWKGGISYLPYCFKFNTRRKRAVRIFFGNYCICCGKHVTENITKRGQCEHSVHHVDHDKEQGCNGKPFNLVPLCVKCHTRELGREQEYRNYINKTLEEGFKWGIWSREQYEIEVMYPEDA